MLGIKVQPVSMDPFQDLRQLQQGMNLLFEGVGEASLFPAVNVWSNNEEAMVTAELPGVASEQIAITVTGDTLTLEGERKAEELADGVVCHRAERGNGKFSRIIRLPFEVAGDKVKAKTKNGVLTVILPRSEASKPHKIAIIAG